MASIAPIVTATWNERVVGGFGGFAAGLTLPAGYSEPVLMLTTDGVGTKLELARRFNRWEGVGFDLVAMVVDDLAAVGAAPSGSGRLHGGGRPRSATRHRHRFLDCRCLRGRRLRTPRW